MIDKILSFDQAWLIAWNNFANSSHFWLKSIKFIAECLIYLVPVMLIILWFWKAESKKVALRATFAGLVAWLIASNIIGRLINRPRPFESLDVHELIFHRPTYSFPSDHAAFLFALCFSFWLSGYKKIALAIFILAIIIGAARIAVGVHFPSDIIAGGILGIFIAWLIELLDRPLRIVYNLLIRIARLIKLA